MKIHDLPPPQPPAESDEPRESRETAPDATPLTPGTDTVTLSEAGRLLAKAREVVYATPESRPEKVAQLKEAVAKGSYQIDTRQLADSLLTDALTTAPKPPADE